MRSTPARPPLLHATCRARSCPSSVAPGRRTIQGGQATPLVAVALLVAALIALALARHGGIVVDAARARTAADAAALAGVDGGRTGSARLAAEHGATLVAWSSSGPPDALTVTVTVRVGRASASAAASNRGP